MADSLTPAQRSERMGRVRSKHTTPELVVRRTLHRLGFRFRLHGRGLPGKPDIVLAKHRTVIFVNGCFWHRHDASSCKLSRMPKSRQDFWIPKLNANKARDKANYERLQREGWRVRLVWECQLNDKEKLEKQLGECFRK